MLNANFRGKEALVLLYRLLLAFLFYGLARVLFILYNNQLVHVNSFSEYIFLATKGLTFDVITIFYINLLFIVLSVLPLVVNTGKRFQKLLFYVYFIPNLAAYATNFIDLIYYKFIQARTTVNVFDTLKNETNLVTLFSGFLIRYWHVFILFTVLAALWIFLYKKINISEATVTNKKVYFPVSLLYLILTGVVVLGGIRGDLRKSTRPLNLVDASRYVHKMEHADVILNTPFTIIRTVGKNTFVKQHFMPDAEAESIANPIKQYHSDTLTKPNIVLFITESFAREYSGVFNEDYAIKDFKSYTPFIDSLARESLYFTNAYANGRKSIHGMSSVLAGIPSFKEAFTSSPFPQQKIQSLVSVLNDMGYDTSFFHGAPNGSMGFLGFGNILGYDHYYGKTEYNNDDDFDGVWGIWDEPFFQFMKRTLDGKKEPFFATMFSVTSHEPYQIPEKYKNTFPKGTIAIHKTIGYTDYAFKRFFEEAKKQPWFNNTLFIITADHTNLSAYDFYGQMMHRAAVPILFYTPNGNLKGKRTDMAQQIDIYPTVLNYMGYNQPFRSWGRSLLSDKETPFVWNYVSNQYMFARGNYIVLFDGKQAIGFYDINDKGLTKNLINRRNTEMDRLETECKAYLQDYFYRIMDKNLITLIRKSVHFSTLFSICQGLFCFPCLLSFPFCRNFSYLWQVQFLIWPILFR